MSKNNSNNSIEVEENDLNENNINNEKEKKEVKIKIKRNRGHSDFGHHLSYNKKLENELDSLPNKINKFFRQSLDKYKFQLEVYVPHSMVISKKEYYNKNYMLNHLVETEGIIKGKKKQIAPISKETKKFSHQYEFVRNENMRHQLDYLSKIEKMYKNKGYNTTGINYKKEDNIFSPSFLLDIKYGKNCQSDAVKYSENNYKNEYKIDKWLLNKFDEYIQMKNKGYIGKNKNKNELNFEDDEEKQKMNEQIKKELNEQIRIENMSKKEYINHSNKIKKEIDTIKNTINNFKELNEYFSKKNNIYNNKSKTIDYDNYKNENELKLNDYNTKEKKKQLFDFNSNLFVSSKGMKDIKSYTKGNIETLPEIKNLKKNNDVNKYKTISTEEKKGPTNKNIDLKKNIKIPILNLKEVQKNNRRSSNAYLSERKLKEIQKERQLNQLYNKLINRKGNTIFPYKQINQYFSKYTRRRLPVANTDRGSNIHGLAEEVQNIINENNFSGFAKLNNNTKKDIKKYKNEEYQNKKILDEEYIQNLDNKILSMHYDFTDKILSNKKNLNTIEQIK